MEQHTRFITWIIIVLTFPLLGILAWNQFNWLQELQKREKNRIESSMFSSAQMLSKGLQEEIMFLPSLLRIRLEENSDIDAIFSDRFRFWQYYALFPSMVSHIYLIDEASGISLEWKDNAFTAVINQRQPEDNFGKTTIEESDTELRILLPIFGTSESRKKILCIIDKDILLQEVLPAIAREKLESTEVYAYRIINTQTGALLYTSLEKKSADIFMSPDIQVPVFEQIRLPTFRQAPDFYSGRLPEKYYESFAFIKERTKTENSSPPDGYQSPFFSYMILQIANKDGSLRSLSKKATIQNASISFGVVILLALVIIMLTEATRRARSLALRQQEFIATITHELKTPLAVISSASQNLTDGIVRDPKKIGQYGAMIKKEAVRLGLSIEHFLLYSNINSITRASPVLCDVGAMLERALKISEEDRQNMEFRTEVLLPDEPVFIQGDKVALESVFQNLVQNVLKHANTGKYLGIVLSLEEENRKNRRRMIIIKVRDKGPGIPSREQKVIFEPFTRGKRAVDEQIPGNGIGLNLIRRIITVHGGSITLESTIDLGSTFIIALPA